MENPTAEIKMRCIGCGKELPGSLPITASWHFDADGYLKREYHQPVCKQCGQWWMREIANKKFKE